MGCRATAHSFTASVSPAAVALPTATCCASVPRRSCFADRMSIHPIRRGGRTLAAELHLSVAAIKSHLRAVAHSFGIEDLPQQQKRRRLVALAFASGLISDRDL